MHSTTDLCPDWPSVVELRGHVWHAASLLAPTLGLKVSGRQGVWKALPVGPKWPGSTVVHSDASVRLVALEKLPPLQGNGDDAPSGQWYPTWQLSQAVEPLAR